MQHAFSSLVSRHVTVVTISRDDIQAGNLVPALASLNNLLASKAALGRSRCALAATTAIRGIRAGFPRYKTTSGAGYGLSLLVLCLHAYRAFTAHAVHAAGGFDARAKPGWRNQCVVR